MSDIKEWLTRREESDLVLMGRKIAGEIRLYIATLEKESADNLHRALAAEKERWISVSDALPSEYEEVLTYGKEGFEVGMFYPRGHAMSGSKGSAWIDSKGYSLRVVKSWRPISAPNTYTQSTDEKSYP